jgi:hypothetical protein
MYVVHGAPFKLEKQPNQKQKFGKQLKSKIEIGKVESSPAVRDQLSQFLLSTFWFLLSAQYFSQ